MAQAVVDGFKAIKIDITQGNARMLRLCAVNTQFQPVLQQYPVRQTGQAVVLCLIGDGFFFFSLISRSIQI